MYTTEAKIVRRNNDPMHGLPCARSGQRDACSRGALGKLTVLELQGNLAVTEVSIRALADAVSQGALGSLKKFITSSELKLHPELVAACKRRRIEIASGWDLPPDENI